MSTFLYGISTCLSLIFAVGAQNAFVLKQGLKKHYIFTVCLICALSDTILVSLGVMGFAQIATNYPNAVVWAKYFGGAFLVVYGLQCFYRAWKLNESLLPTGNEVGGLGRVIATCLAFTWLNPHVYIDTLFLIGSISTRFEHEKFQFAAGVIVTSWVFFFSFGYAAKFLSPLLKSARAWKILDIIIGLLMWIIAYNVMLG